MRAPNVMARKSRTKTGGLQSHGPALDGCHFSSQPRLVSVRTWSQRGQGGAQPPFGFLNFFSISLPIYLACFILIHHVPLFVN